VQKNIAIQKCKKIKLIITNVDGVLTNDGHGVLREVADLILSIQFGIHDKQ